MAIEEAEKKSVDYERPVSQYATRRQFRWVMILLIINLAITIQSNYWPGLASSVKGQWTQYRERRRAKALQQQAMNWSEPATKVVWDENPDTAAALLLQPDYKAIRVSGVERMPTLKNWPRGAHAVLASSIDQFYRDRFNIMYHHPFPNRSGEPSVEADENALILMHNFKIGGGEQRLVYVYVQGKLDLQGAKLPGEGRSIQDVAWDKSFSATVAKELTIVAVPCSIAAEDKVPVVLANEGATLLVHPHVQPGQVQWSWTPQIGDKPEHIQLTGGGFFRFYAGQIDPADPSHFTIMYDLDGKQGTIHGRIRSNGLVELRPDSGKVAGSNWFPQQ
jgi:hypothetical protein